MGHRRKHKHENLTIWQKLKEQKVLGC